ncbi:hypothetical protein GW17_00002298 [Ensete ventricosum]|nr:hypothetical protein GW17_00002298 [Ensete ventricosum]
MRRGRKGGQVARATAFFHLFPPLLLLLLLLLPAVGAEDPYLHFTWNVTYGTVSPLGVPQLAILINGEFPGPNINSTTINNIIVNVKDQIGCFVYFPALGMHRAAGGSGGLRVNSSFLIPVPFADPADDYTVLVGD